MELNDDISKEPIPWTARIDASDMEILIRSRLPTPLTVEDVYHYFGHNHVRQSDDTLYTTVAIPHGWFTLGSPYWSIVCRYKDGLITNMEVRRLSGL